jgi:hypothetical protein
MVNRPFEINTGLKNEEFYKFEKAQSLNSNTDVNETLPKKIFDQIDPIKEDQIRNIVGSENVIPRIIQETPIYRDWKIIKSSLFSLFEYNGEYSDIIKQVKKSLRKQYKDLFSEIGNLIFYIFNIF